MAEHLDQYLEHLEGFLIRHRKRCNSTLCRCAAVADHLSSPEGDLKADRLWYEFIIEYIGLKFSLGRMEKLPRSEM
jgi:hypothetical protein